MNTEELNEYQENVTKRLADYLEGNEEQATKVLKLIVNGYSCRGAMLYCVSDRLETKGY